jgi:hypothetical protein
VVRDRFKEEDWVQGGKMVSSSWGHLKSPADSSLKSGAINSGEKGKQKRGSDHKLTFEAVT